MCIILPDVRATGMRSMHYYIYCMRMGLYETQMDGGSR